MQLSSPLKLPYDRNQSPIRVNTINRPSFKQHSNHTPLQPRDKPTHSRKDIHQLITQTQGKNQTESELGKQYRYKRLQHENERINQEYGRNRLCKDDYSGQRHAKSPVMSTHSKSPLNSDLTNRNPSNVLQDQTNRKYCGKNLQIEQKLHKINSYHQKIQNLLQIINIKPKTPTKSNQNHSPATPNRTKNEKLDRKRSITRLFDNKKSSYVLPNQQSPSRQQIPRKNLLRQQKRLHPEEQKDTSIHNYQIQVKESCPSQYYNQKEKNRNFPQKYHDQVIENPKSSTPTRNWNQSPSKNGFIRMNKHVNLENKEKEKSIEHKREKSKEFMKALQGQVKDIQNTIQLLNIRINQVKPLPFKKEVEFDALSSNPESLNDISSSSVEDSYRPSDKRPKNPKLNQTKTSNSYQYRDVTQKVGSDKLNQKKNIDRMVNLQNSSKFKEPVPREKKDAYPQNNEIRGKNNYDDQMISRKYVFDLQSRQKNQNR